MTKNGDFDIQSFYNKLRSPLPNLFPWKGVWKVKAPWRVSFFVWTTVWDKILTSDNLRGRGIDFVDWIICCFIVVRLIGCGVWCLDLLGFNGSCQDRLRIVYLVGGISLESIRLAFGI